MQHSYEFPLPEVTPPTPESKPAVADSLPRRSRVPGAYVCRSGPRSSRYAAIRESCASFRLACSLRPSTAGKQPDAR
jgi:hypothetical protein